MRADHAKSFRDVGLSFVVLILFKWGQIYTKLSFFLHFYVENVFEQATFNVL